MNWEIPDWGGGPSLFVTFNLYATARGPKAHTHTHTHTHTHACTHLYTHVYVTDTCNTHIHLCLHNTCFILGMYEYQYLVSYMLFLAPSLHFLPVSLALALVQVWHDCPWYSYGFWLFTTIPLLLLQRPSHLMRMLSGTLAAIAF